MKPAVPRTVLAALAALAAAAAAPTAGANAVFTLDGIDGGAAVILHECDAVISESRALPLLDNGQLTPRLVPGLPTWRGLRCARDAIADNTLRLWRRQIEDGSNSGFFDVRLTSPRDPTGEQVEWQLLRAWPAAWSVKCSAFHTTCREHIELAFNGVRDNLSGDLEPAPEPRRNTLPPRAGSSSGSALHGLVLLLVLGGCLRWRRRGRWPAGSGGLRGQR